MRRLSVGGLGAIQRIAAGGQGVVYTAPGAKMHYSSALVFKEYKPAVRAGLDVTVLDAMPAYLESLAFAEGMELLSRAAWPCRLVEDATGSVVGFVMPTIPPEFFIDMTMASGTKRVTAEFQHLLNDDSFLARRGIGLTDRGRYALIDELAQALAILHRHRISVGDLSPKNLLFSLVPHPRVYFIDCDAMRFQDQSVTPQMETPGWDVHAVHPGEELATSATDNYKLGLLALRLLVGDQSTRDPQRLPPRTPPPVRALITQALDPHRAKRPAPAGWHGALTAAAATASTKLPAAPPPPRPATPMRMPPAPPPTTPPRTAPLYAASRTATPMRSTIKPGHVIVGLVVTAAIIVALVMAFGGKDETPSTPNAGSVWRSLPVQASLGPSSPAVVQLGPISNQLRQAGVPNGNFDGAAIVALTTPAEQDVKVDVVPENDFLAVPHLPAGDTGPKLIVVFGRLGSTATLSALPSQ